MGRTEDDYKNKPNEAVAVPPMAYRTDSNQAMDLPSTAEEALPSFGNTIHLVLEELMREQINHPERIDTSSDYDNRELVHAAQMYVMGGKFKERGYGKDMLQVATRHYPESFGGRARGEELLAKLSAKECYVRAAALLVRQMRRM